VGSNPTPRTFSSQQQHYFKPVKLVAGGIARPLAADSTKIALIVLLYGLRDYSVTRALMITMID
jgi:hypothetical protein